MNSYLLLIFLHVLAAVGIFTAWGSESIILRQLRRARAVDEAEKGMHLLRKQRAMGPISMLIVLATGIWMGVARWGHQDWMVTAFAAMLLIIVVGLVMARRTMPRLKKTLADEPEVLPPDYIALTISLVVSLQLRISIGVGIVGLMTIKPTMPGSLVILGISIALGIITAVYSTRREASDSKREISSHGDKKIMETGN